MSGTHALSSQALVPWLTVVPHSHSYQMMFIKELQMRYLVFVLYNFIKCMVVSNIIANFNSLTSELMPLDLAWKAILGSTATNPGK